MTEEQKSKCRLIYNHYGPRKQLRQLCEECAELIQATIKYDRNGKLDDYSHLCEELADVMIMSEQIKIGLSENMVTSFINEKLDRQIRRIDNEICT